MDPSGTMVQDVSPYSQPGQATAGKPLPPGTRLIASVNQPNNGDFSGVQGRLYLANEALYLAQREAERGEDANARDQLKKAWVQIATLATMDPAAFGQGQAWYASMVQYVDSLAPMADSLKGQATISDATYVKSQVLSAAQQNEYAADNADTQRALDAQANGESPTAAYMSGKIARDVGSAAQGAKDAVSAGLGAALSPFKWWILGGLALTAGAVGVYAYLTGRTARAVAGGAS